MVLPINNLDTMTIKSTFKNQLLIATPSLRDPNFHQAVIYLCEHNEDGAMGLIINKPSPMKLGEILQQLKIEAASKEIEQHPVLIGGPLQQDQGFVIHTQHLPETDENDKDVIQDNLTVSSTRDVLAAFAKGKGPKKILIILGHAAWDAGQLEQELAENAWIVTPTDSDILLNVPFNQRWRAAAALIGLDIDRLSSETGHA